MTPPTALADSRPRDENRLRVEDAAAHDWYRFVLSYPPHLVRDYLERFYVQPGMRVLDPFCGTGTTLVECKKLGLEAVGLEANPLACFASQVKTDWNVNADELWRHATQVAGNARRRLEADGIEDEEAPPLFRAHRRERQESKLRSLPAEAFQLLLQDSISPRPLHKVLVLLEALEKDRDPRFERYERLALARALVTGISNLEFGPEVGVGPAKPDAPVVSAWLSCVQRMVNDLHTLHGCPQAPSVVHHADAREPGRVVQAESIDAVITSPPYPNEKDYTRTTRLESVLLGFLRDRKGLQALKKTLVRSNTRSVYRGDEDDKFVQRHGEIQRIAKTIEARRIELGKTSGFERMYHRVTKLYFGGMARHLAALSAVLRPGARLAYVVGDQASYLRVMIRTGQLLADIAESAGYEVVGIDLFRTRLATATREQLREEVVLLRWPGAARHTGR
jgi:SAM-dependent methyltransferase